MIALVLSSFLFGLANPLAAILVGGEDSMIFTFQFLAALVLIQLPLVLTQWREVFKLTFRHGFSLLMVSGLTGTFLYWCEFSSYQVGLPITHVTFLMLTVPAWTLLYEYLRGRGSHKSINKLAIALVGTAFLIQPNDKGQFSFSFLLPVFTSLLTAAWIIFSKKAQEKNISPIVCSFFNDLFALMGVVGFILFNGRQGSLLIIPDNSQNILLYAAMIGVLPSILLLYGLKSTSLVTASTIIMFDPVMSGTLSILINNEVLGVNFLMGSILVCLSNVPENASLHWLRFKGEYWVRIKSEYGFISFK